MKISYDVNNLEEWKELQNVNLPFYFTEDEYDSSILNDITLQNIDLIKNIVINKNFEINELFSQLLDNYLDRMQNPYSVSSRCSHKIRFPIFSIISRV